MDDVELFFYFYLVLVAWCLCGENDFAEPPRHEDTKEAIVVGLDHSSSLVDDAIFLACF